MKQSAICENHLFQKAYKNGKRASSRSVTVYVLKDRRAALLRKQNPEKKFLLFYIRHFGVKNVHSMRWERKIL